MGTEVRINNRRDVVGMQLVACGKHKGNSCENGDITSIQKMEMLSVNGVRTYKRRKHPRSTSGNMGEQARNPLLEAAEGHLEDKNSAKENMGIISEGSCNDSNTQANVQINTELCQHIFNDVICSEKFDGLRKLLSENFQGIKIESLSDFSVINSRFTNGVYGLSPQLFSEDIQQLWSTLTNIGVEMVSLAKGLSDMSRKFCHEQIGGSANEDCVEDKQEETSKQEEPNKEKTCICRCCGGKTDGRICIVCDSCENMYHVFCVGVSVSEDCPCSWYCMNCIDTRSDSVSVPPHQNCFACEKLKDPSTNPIQMDADPVPNHYERKDNICKLCRCGFSNSLYRECEHALCFNKFHLKCLSDMELKRFGRRWYCSSCLCRVCLVDQDDEQIVICDGCDNGYHIYCMEPPRDMIPSGKWFCGLCETRLSVIRKAKIREQRKGSMKKGMAMLLSAVEMVKHQENLLK